MLLQPKKTKHVKLQKGRLKKFEFKKTQLVFGDVGLKAKCSGIITARQIEATRRAIVRKLERKGKLWIKIFPNQPITAKANESRMGKGKGNISHWAVKVSRGCVLFEICGIPISSAKTALISGGKKLPLKTKIIV